MHIFSSLLEVSFLKKYGKLKKIINFKYSCRKQGHFFSAIQKYFCNTSRQLLLGLTYLQTYPIPTGPSLVLLMSIPCLGVFFQNCQQMLTRACGWQKWMLVAHGSEKYSGRFAFRGYVAERRRMDVGHHKSQLAGTWAERAREGLGMIQRCLVGSFCARCAASKQEG